MFNLKLRNGSWRVDFWGTDKTVWKVNDVSIPELYVWRRIQSSGLFLHRHCICLFVYFKISFTLKSHRTYHRGSNSQHPRQQNYFWKSHFKAWCGKSLAAWQKLQDHVCLLEQNLQWTQHFSSHIPQRKRAVSDA